MPAAKPSTLPEWASGGSAEVTEPTLEKKQAGWIVEKPSHDYFNWWQNLVYRWAAYLDDLANHAFTWTATHLFQGPVTVSTPDAAGAALSVTCADDAPGTYGANVIGVENGVYITVGGAGGGGTALKLQASASTKDALEVNRGVVRFTGTAPLSSDDVGANALNRMSFPKAWARISCVAGTVTLISGHNILSVGTFVNDIAITLKHAMADTSYAVVCQRMATSTEVWVSGVPSSATGVLVKVTDSSGAHVNASAVTNTEFVVLVYGDQ